MSWQPKHVIALAVALAAGLTLSPIASHAAGQLMTIVDPVTNKGAAVSPTGRLGVENRPSVNGSNSTKQISSATAQPLLQITYPTRYAVHEFTLANGGSAPARVILEWRRRLSGTATCATVSSWTSGQVVTPLRTVLVPGSSTLAVDLSSMPVVSPIQSSGQLTCLVALVITTSTPNMNVGLTYHSP